MSLQYPQKENLEIFICIYLPGFFIAVVFLILITQEHWIDQLIIDKDNLQQEDKKDKKDEKDENLGNKVKHEQADEKKKDLVKINKIGSDYINAINTGLVLAIYTFYFIAVPFIFGTLADGLRHSVSKLANYLFTFKGLKFLKWRYPTKRGYMQWVNEQGKRFNEVIYLRKVDKSHLLFHTYEFFGNIASSIIITVFAYIFYISYLIFAYIYYPPPDPQPPLKDVLPSLQYILPLYCAAIILFCCCILFMYVFWKENEDHCKNWALYLDEDYQ